MTRPAEPSGAAPPPPGDGGRPPGVDPSGGKPLDRSTIVGEAMSDVFTTPVKTKRRFTIAGVLARIPLFRWFKGSLPGRISGVFLLAAAVTVAGLLYATPRLESSLVAPRERAVESTLSLGALYVRFLPTVRTDDGQPLTLPQYPSALGGLFGFGRLNQNQQKLPGLGGTSQRLTLFAVVGNQTRPTFVDLVGNDRASPLVRRLALRSNGRTSGVTSVGGVSRVEAVEVITLSGGQRVALSVWQPITDIQQTVDIARQRILVAGIGGASIALLLGVWVTTRLTRRIRTLEAGARKVARGDFTAQFPGEGSLELSSLARALDEMQGQLAELETARRRFIATASHELRTPLSTLQGFLELLEDEDLPTDRRREFVMHASQQAQRLGKLASDLLDLSRLDVGSVKVRREPVDVGLLLEGLLMEFRAVSAQDGTLITKQVDPRAETAMVDGDRVLQLLRALVDNALTHTPAGTPIRVMARRSGARVEFMVEDAGPGIPVAHQREMFEAFVTSDETRGSGLGLAISRELARRMNGDLTVTSGPGSTVFTLSLPA
ncbi:MAG: HAMP domain-containing sensor histidine kinase [Solirubrobacteraceae bacterium]|nr:HAMP domain-containing sensor histidine kinase [Solirubrobacteraceae bacterium]